MTPNFARNITNIYMLDNPDKYIYLLLHEYRECDQIQPDIHKYTVLLQLLLDKVFIVVLKKKTCTLMCIIILNIINYWFTFCINLRDFIILKNEVKFKWF